MKTDTYLAGSSFPEISRPPGTAALLRYGTPRIQLFQPLRILQLLAFMVGCFVPSWVQSQPEWEKVWSIPQNARWIAADQLRQLYVVTPSNEVIKYSSEGEVLYRYNNNTLGTLQYLDATDPFSLLLYYPDYQVVQVLDRTLNLMAEFRLWQYGIFQPRAIGMANDNQLWIYDEAVFRLKKLDPNGKVLAQSDDLNLLLGKQPRPDMLLVRQNRIWLLDSEQGIIVFDNFGQYSHTLTLQNLSRIRIFDDKSIWCFVQHEWKCFDALTFLPRTVHIPADLAANPHTIIFPDYLFTLEPDGVSAWKQ